mmetsp:Transcript_41765/g.121032  ORF Transcript_41765/g.121032 Transcript_41765/m.121032 type:complete len:205 (-) Transcript_41765:258-872(-)
MDAVGGLRGLPQLRAEPLPAAPGRGPGAGAGARGRGGARDSPRGLRPRRRARCEAAGDDPPQVLCGYCPPPQADFTASGTPRTTQEALPQPAPRDLHAAAPRQPAPDPRPDPGPDPRQPAPGPQGARRGRAAGGVRPGAGRRAAGDAGEHRGAVGGGGAEGAGGARGRDQAHGRDGRGGCLHSREELPDDQADRPRYEPAVHEV